MPGRETSQPSPEEIGLELDTDTPQEAGIELETPSPGGVELEETPQQEAISGKEKTEKEKIDFWIAEKKAETLPAMEQKLHEIENLKNEALAAFQELDLSDPKVKNDLEQIVRVTERLLPAVLRGDGSMLFKNGADIDDDLRGIKDVLQRLANKTYKPGMGQNAAGKAHNIAFNPNWRSKYDTAATWERVAKAELKKSGEIGS